MYPSHSPPIATLPHHSNSRLLAPSCAQAANLDTFALNLYSGNSLTPVASISPTVTTSTGQLLWTFPG
jgi:hypothetical protein